MASHSHNTCFEHRSLVRSSPGAHLVEEQVAQPTTAPNIPTLAPPVINVDKHAAYPKARADLKAARILSEDVELRPVTYLNNPVKQAHHFIKRLVKPGIGFFSLETAWRML